MEEERRINYFEHLVAPDKAASFLSVFAEIINKTEYSLVRLKVSGSDELKIQIMAEREDRSMIIEDCKKLSNILIEFLEGKQNIIDNYTLEVSSPGIDRPLTSEEDFLFWVGNNVVVQLKKPLNALKKYEGILKGFINEKIEIIISNDLNDSLVIDPKIVKGINIVWSPETSQ